MTEAGPVDLISEDEDEEEGWKDIKLPGVRKGGQNREVVFGHFSAKNYLLE